MLVAEVDHGNDAASAMAHQSAMSKKGTRDHVGRRGSSRVRGFEIVIGSPPVLAASFCRVKRAQQPTR